MRHKILIIGPFPGPPKGISLSNQVVATGLMNKGWKVQKINTEHSKEVNSEIGHFSFEKLSFIKTYFQAYKIFGIDVVYITIGITFFGVLKYAPFILLAKMFNKKTIVHVHSDHLKKEYQSLSGVKQRVFYQLMAMFDAGIVLSPSLRANLNPFLSEKNIYELYNFVEQKLAEPVLDQIKKKDFSKIRLVFLSNLLEEKGINVLLQALKKLNSEGIPLKLKIAGNTISGNPLEDIINEVETVEYLGVVAGKQKQELLLWGNVFCLPTYFNMEGQPISILEAMAFDHLILTTKHAGIPDICSDENAIFCKENDAEDLSLKLKHIILNWEQLQKNAISNGVYARNKFTETKFISTLENIIFETLRK